MAATWIDLLDPTAEELQREGAERARAERRSRCSSRRPSTRTSRGRRSQGHGDYVFGVFLVAVAVPDEDDVYYQEIDLVAHARHAAHRAQDAAGRPAAVRRRDRHARRVQADDSAGMIAYRLVDEIAERYLDLVDDLNDEIDELEDKVEDQPARLTRDRISRAPPRPPPHPPHARADARRRARVVDDGVEVDDGTEVFPHDVELAFNAAYDKLLRATDGLELSRDLLAACATTTRRRSRTTRTR